VRSIRHQPTTTRLWCEDAGLRTTVLPMANMCSSSSQKCCLFRFPLLLARVRAIIGNLFQMPPFTEGEATAMSVLTSSRTSHDLSGAPKKTRQSTGGRPRGKDHSVISSLWLTSARPEPPVSNPLAARSRVLGWWSHRLPHFALPPWTTRGNTLPRRDGRASPPAAASDVRYSAVKDDAYVTTVKVYSLKRLAQAKSLA
jgi:hypothetical protein